MCSAAVCSVVCGYMVSMQQATADLGARVLSDRHHPLLLRVAQPQVVGLRPTHHLNKKKEAYWNGTAGAAGAGMMTAWLRTPAHRFL